MLTREKIGQGGCHLVITAFGPVSEFPTGLGGRSG